MSLPGAGNYGKIISSQRSRRFDLPAIEPHLTSVCFSVTRKLANVGCGFLVGGAMIPTIKYRGYNTHDPEIAEQEYLKKFGVNPTALVIRPAFSVTKYHRLLVESSYGAALAILATHEATVEEIRAIEGEVRPPRPPMPDIDGYSYLRPRSSNIEEERKPIQNYAKKPSPKPRPAVKDIAYIREFHQTPGSVYLIASENGYQKIGRAKDVESRRVGLEREIPLVMTLVHSFKTDYYIAAESLLHEEYDDRRIRYEWFRLKDNQIKKIMSISDYQIDDILEKKLLRDLY